MVTPVDTSLSLSSPLPAAPELATLGNDVSLASVETPQEPVGATRSPSWLRGSSLATDAWIASAQTGSAAVSDTATDSTTNAADDANGTPKVAESNSSSDLGSATAASGMRSKKLSIASEDMLVDAIITFNKTLQRLPTLEKQMQEFQAGLGSATDAQMVTYLHQMIELTASAITQANAIVSNSPSAIEDGLEEIKHSRSVTGTIYTRNSDGSFSFGQFSIHIRIPDGSSLLSMSHDGSGTAIKNVYTESGTESTEVPLY